MNSKTYTVVARNIVERTDEVFKNVLTYGQEYGIFWLAFADKSMVYLSTCTYPRIDCTLTRAADE